MRFVLFSCLGIIFLACNLQQPGPSKTVFNINEVRAYIEEMNKTYSMRFTTNDTAFYSARYCTDAEVFAPEIPVIRGRIAIRDYFYNNGLNKDAVIELPAGNFYGSEDLIIEEGAYNFPDGKGGSFDKGKFIAIWKKEDDSWKLYREIWNSDILPPSLTK